MKKNLIPAPIDEKNVTSDWIGEIFDNYGDYVMCDNKFTGFVKGTVCYCEYINNHLFWQVSMNFAKDAKASWNELIRRLKEHDTPPLVVEYDDSMKDELLLLQNFYWKNE